MNKFGPHEAASDVGEKKRRDAKVAVMPVRRGHFFIFTNSSHLFFFSAVIKSLQRSSPCVNPVIYYPDTSYP